MGTVELETRIWLVAESLYHEDHADAGRLIYADDSLRSGYVRTAVKVVTAMTDRFGPSQARRLDQAAADYACHRAGVIRRSTLRCYALSQEGRE